MPTSLPSKLPDPAAQADGAYVPVGPPTSPTESGPAFSLTRPDGTVDVLYRPTPKQLEFHACEAPNCILEGTRGTGKSLAIRMDAHMRAMAHSGLAYLIVRRTMPELRKSHLRFIDAEMKKLGGWFNKTENCAYYPPDPVTGKQSLGYFFHCESDADVLNFLSSEFAVIYFDEITTFPGEMVTKIATCARVSEDSGLLALVRGGTNPIGEGAEYVRSYYIDKNVSPEVDPDYIPDDYVAIHTTLDDNPHINRGDYIKRFSGLPEHIRRAWLYGEWVAEGAYFSDFQSAKIDLATGERRPWHVIEALPTVKGKPLLEQPWILIYRALDWGYHPDPAVCLWIAVLPNKRAIVFKERTWLKTTAAEVAKEIVRESEGMRVVDTYNDPSMQAAAGHTGLSIGDYFEMNGVPLTPSRNDRAAAGMAIHEWLNTIIDEEPKIQILREACPNLIKTLPDMRVDKRDAAKIAGGGNDHYVIALSYFCQGDVTPSRDPETPAVPLWMRKPSTRHVLGQSQVQRRSIDV